MPEAFERLHGDLILELTKYLTAGDMLACRLVSKATRHCFGLSFDRLFTNCTLDLTPSGLRRMRGILDIPGVAHSIRSLRVNAIHYHDWPSPVPRRYPRKKIPARTIYENYTTWQREACTPAQGSWLSDRLTEQVASAAGSGVAMRDTLADILQTLLMGLQTLSLEAVVVLHKMSRVSPLKCSMLNLGSFWSRAIQAYQIMMSALARSQICHLEELIIFEDTQMCSIPSNELGLPLDWDQTAKLRIICSRLKRFSVSITTPFLPRRPKLILPRTRSFYEPVDVLPHPVDVCYDDNISERLKTLCWKDHPGCNRFIQFFQLIRNVESLRIHFYRPGSFRREPRDFNEVAQVVEGLGHVLSASFKGHKVLKNPTLPPLRLLVLAGIQAVKNDLEAFLLELPQLRSLELKHVRLSTSLSTQRIVKSGDYNCREWTELIQGTLVDRMPRLERLCLSDLELESSYVDFVHGNGRLCCLRILWDEISKTGHDNNKQTTMPGFNAPQCLYRDCIRLSSTQVLSSHPPLSYQVSFAVDIGMSHLRNPVGSQRLRLRAFIPFVNYSTREAVKYFEYLAPLRSEYGPPPISQASYFIRDKELGTYSRFEPRRDPDAFLGTDALLELWDDEDLCYYGQDSL
ncbi:hypothetical protein PgNI_10266 [Pyricularia grisea]|uniref:F-box domain-containing protein n=1 Tax=Pyricularia grisea TaxID=148305 RepID=A0A6P8AXP5_PYRGI|nr:hypothetical protein PgNI_10266 [Pyricularia grisea]TLD07059.1 hypothetical protein PgNI_10266 [Pyricularia grisea]